MSYYKIIDGKKYDKSLLETADRLTEGVGDGRISFDDAKVLLTEAMDGAKITRIEYRTLMYILKNYKVTDKAAEHMKSRLLRMYNGESYDVLLIDAAELAVEGKGDGKVSLADAELIWRLVDADNHVTEMELRTIIYIKDTFNCTEPAKNFFEGKLAAY